MGPEVQLISSGAEAAKYARQCLETQNLLADRQTPGENTYYVSDSTEMFIENAGPSCTRSNGKGVSLQLIRGKERSR